MDSDLRQSMFRYYDERAPQYEEAYLLGTGTASIRDPRVIHAEASLLGPIVERFGRGRIIDIACGTAYWLPHYARRCTHITLLDQSEKMLDESRKKAAAFGVLDRCSIVCADFFDYQFAKGSCDSALIGFLFSHLTVEQERLAFARLEALLGEDGEFLILDSAWSPQRAQVNAKVEHQERQLNDGTRFDIYKRYFDEEDIRRWGDSYGVMLRVEHFGAAFLAVSGRFVSGRIAREA
jgi:demethylmenaquinone methyltransferase/2-methoxy-6-polyprenyl-1,4-benzoquinol methylase